MAIAVVLIAGGFTYLSGDWLAGVAVLLLGAIWYLLREKDVPPVLPLALTFQWTQVTCGIFYHALTGREVEAIYASDYRPAVMMGLGCVTALLVGLTLGTRIAPRKWRDLSGRPYYVGTWRLLLIAYGVSWVLAIFLARIAWSIPLLTQGVLAVGYLHLAILFLLFRRLSQPRFHAAWFAGLLVVEVGFGFTGYFAGFKEPLVLAGLALLTTFDRRSPPHWLRLAGLTAAAFLTGILWTGIRNTYRAGFSETSTRTERMGDVGTLSSGWAQGELESFMNDADSMVERLWTIYFPALAIARVPQMLPHTNGSLMRAALRHIVMPRFLFPDKPALGSDSELVRLYTGIYVASTEQNTSIAFGYMAESYVDFGLPWMFLPSFVFGVLMGIAYRFMFFIIRHQELAMGLVGVVFWLSLYLFERSWIKTLGLSLTLMIYAGGVVLLIDRGLTRASRRPARAMMGSRPRAVTTTR